MTLRYAFLDESPSLSSTHRFFAVGILITKSLRRTPLTRIPKRIRSRVLGKKLRQVPEVKFYNSDDRVRRTVLEMISRQDVELAIYVVDKEGRSVIDAPANYGVVVGSAVSILLREVHARISLTVDKRYTSPEDREVFTQVVEAIAADQALNGFLSLTTHAESHRESLVQLADFVVGSAHQKYNWGDASYLEIVADKLVLQTTAKWTDIKTAWIEIERKQKG